MRKYFSNVFSYLSTLNVEYVNVILTAYVLKMLTISATFEEAVVFASIVSLVAFKTYNKRFEPREFTDTQFKEEVNAELKDIKQALGVLKLSPQNRTKNTDDKRYF